VSGRRLVADGPVRPEAEIDDPGHPRSPAHPRGWRTRIGTTEVLHSGECDRASHRRAKFHQELLFESPEWKSAYNSLRNTNEGMNGYIKDPAHEALDDPGRRRIHGVAAQSLFVALLAMAANVRKIRSFLAARGPKGSDRSRRPRRRKTTPIAHWRPTVATTTGSSDPDPPLIA